MERLQPRIPGMSALRFDGVDLLQAQVDNFNRTVGEPNGYHCPLCNDRGGSMYLDDLGYKVFRPCECARIRSTMVKVKNSGMERMIRDKTFASFRVTEPWQEALVNTCREYLTEEGAWLVISGQSGCGKTHLCTAVCRELAKNGRQTIYMRWLDAASRLKDMDLDSEIRNTEKEKFKTAEVLYIDDLLKTGGNGNPSRAELNLAFEIINYRYGLCLPTVISTELSPDQLMDLDQALGGRIQEMAGRFHLYIAPNRSRNMRLRGNVAQ